MPTLENNQVRLSVDEDGNLTELRNKATGRQYAGGGPLWRLYFERGDQKDREILSAPRPEIRCSGQGMELVYRSVLYQGGRMDIGVVVSVRLDGESTRWSIALKNAADVILRECQFPLVQGLDVGRDHALIWSNRGGQRLDDVRAAIKRHFTHYIASDHVFLHMDETYPGAAAMNCYAFCAEAEGLYCGCHDASFEQTCHLFRLYGDALECGFARYPGLKQGESRKLGEFVLSPYCGTWHAAADLYRAWADGWHVRRPGPDWVARFKGWQRIILKHQYGEVHYAYGDLDKIHRDGLASGIDALHLFGWWKGGMDNGNPDYVFDEAMGGKATLKSQIARFQENGSVILYSSGRLIDLASDYYKAVGARIAIKDRFGAEIRDAYRFRANGTFTGHFGNRTFTAACPACPEWLDKMKEVVDLAVELGCKGVFFDQMGMNEFPCFDPSHGHPVPFLGIAHRKAELVRQLRDYARDKSPDLAVGVECLIDICAQYADFIHSWPGFAEASNDWEGRREKPKLVYFIDWFRYCFPDVVMTDRDIRDDTDVERRVNHALLKGLRSDVEIYRCRRTIAETPHYGHYLKQANALRDEFAEYLLEGTYRDTMPFSLDNAEIEARCFVHGKGLAVVATQSHLETASGIVRVPGYVYARHGGIGAVSCRAVGAHLEEIEIALPKHGILVVEFHQRQLEE